MILSAQRTHNYSLALLALIFVVTAITFLAPLIGLGRSDDFIFYQWFGLRRSVLVKLELALLLGFFAVSVIGRYGNLIRDVYQARTLHFSLTFYSLVLFIISCFQFIIWGKHMAFEWTTMADIPPMLHLMDSQFLANDFYTVASVNTPKDTFQHALLLPTLFGIDWYQAIYLYKVLFLLLLKPLLFLCILKIVMALQPNVQKSTQYSILKLVVFFMVALGVIEYQGEPAGWPSVFSIIRVTAYGFSVFFGLGYLVTSLSENRYTKNVSYLLLSGAVLIHPTVGAMIFCLSQLFSLVVFADHNKKYLLQKFLVDSIFVVIPLAVILGRYENPAPLSAEQFIQYYVFERHPHHYQMSHAVGFEFFGWLLLFIMPVLISFFLKARKLQLLSILCLLYYTVPVFIQYVGVEIIPIKSIAALGPCRFTYFASFLWWIEILVFCIHLNVLNVIADYCKKIYNHLADIQRSNISRILSSSIMKAGELFEHLLALISRTKKVVFLGVILLAVLVWQQTLKSPLDWKFYGLEEPREVITWINKYTPRESVFFVNDLYYSFLTRSYGGRASFVDNSMPFNESYFAEYFKRLDVYQKAEDMTATDYYQLSQNYSVTHLLIKKEDSQRLSNFDPIYQTNVWNIYNIADFK